MEVPQLNISRFFNSCPPRTDRRILVQKQLMEAFSRYASFVETLLDESLYTPHIVNHLILCRTYTQQGLIESETMELSGAIASTMPPIESVFDLDVQPNTQDLTHQSVVEETQQLATLIYQSISGADCLCQSLGNLTVARNLLLQAIGYNN